LIENIAKQLRFVLFVFKKIVLFVFYIFFVFKKIRVIRVIRVQKKFVLSCSIFSSCSKKFVLFVLFVFKTIVLFVF